jgi:hypothetical protein
MPLSCKIFFGHNINERSLKNTKEKAIVRNRTLTTMKLNLSSIPLKNG